MWGGEGGAARCSAAHSIASPSLPSLNETYCSAASHEAPGHRLCMCVRIHSQSSGPSAPAPPVRGCHGEKCHCSHNDPPADKIPFCNHDDHFQHQPVEMAVLVQTGYHGDLVHRAARGVRWSGTECCRGGNTSGPATPHPAVRADL